MPDSIPLTVTSEAERFISERRLQEPFQRMLDNIPLRIPGVHGVNVSLQHSWEGEEDSRVILDVIRETPAEFDPAEDEWKRWVIENFPPEEFSHFCFVSVYI